MTDHKPLLNLIKEHKAVPSQVSRCIQRWTLTLAAYEYTIAFRPTTAHSNADALNQLQLAALPFDVPPVAETVLLIK